MNGIDWASGDVVLACQLLCAGTLAAHLLILRPRGARKDLLLDARIVQDELDLAERLGHVAAENVETIAVQQVLRRIRQNPRSAGLVLERIPALASTAARNSSITPTDVEYLGGALDRLSDAAQRYLRGAWPRAGALSAVMVAAPARDLHRKALHQNEKDQDAIDLAKIEVAEADVDDADLDDADGDGDDMDLDDLELDDADLDDADSSSSAEMLDLSDEEFAELFGDDLNYEAAGDATTKTSAVHLNGPRAASDLEPAPAPADLPSDAGAPAWLDLVKAETPRRTSGLGLADRHARPYRPARPSGHSSARRVEQLDRSSVLPR